MKTIYLAKLDVISIFSLLILKRLPLSVKLFFNNGDNYVECIECNIKYNLELIISDQKRVDADNMH